MLLKPALFAFAASALCLPRIAWAQKAPPACIAHHEKSQELKLAGKLVESKQELLACASDSSCPSVIQSECDDMLEKLKPIIPSLLFAARDREGQDTVDVAVYSGDKQILTKLEVQGYELDPGEYHFRFVIAGGATKEQAIVVREGEQNRRVLVDFEAPAPAVQSSSTSPQAATMTSRGGAWKRPTGYALIGLGVVGVGVGSYFGLRAKSKNDDARAYCPTSDRCYQQGIDLVHQAKSAATVSTISFGVGIASAVAGTVLVLTAPSSSPERTGVRFAPAIGPGFAGAAAWGRFSW